MKYFRLLIPPIIFLVFKKIKSFSISNTITQFVPDHSLIDSYSQYQEDLIIDSILDKKAGFYVDIGANDPDFLSNTKRFYLKGWSGINIEPQVNKFKEFEDRRTRDTNLNLGVSDQEGVLEFYQLNISTLSSFDLANAKASCKKFNATIDRIIPIEVNKLGNILDEFLPDGQYIDLLSIDTEGFDMKVLLGNNWEKYKPKLILIEYGKESTLIFDLLCSLNYKLVYKNNCNAIFVLF